MTRSERDNGPLPARRGENLCVLLVDDEAAFADALAFRLEARGMNVSVAYRGHTALEYMDRPELEVVLLDLNMPGRHGLEILKDIKGKRPDVDVLLLTGESDISMAACGMRRGAGDYLLKPVDFDALLESLEKARARVARYKERMRAAEAGRLMALGSLAAGVGHEINNPLQIILQRAEWLEELLDETEPDLAQMRASARVVYEQATRAGRVTARLLELAHSSRSGAAQSDVALLLPKVIDRLRQRAQALDVRIIECLNPDLPALPCSPAELDPLLFHLLRNSLDAIEARKMAVQEPAGSDYIRITAEQVRGAVRITVRDSGEGVFPEDMDRLFDPFFSTRPVGSGTGLGLTVCRSIASAFRGEVRNMPSAQGATFVVEIPLPDHAPQQTAG